MANIIEGVKGGFEDFQSTYWKERDLAERTAKMMESMRVSREAERIRNEQLDMQRKSHEMAIGAHKRQREQEEAEKQGYYIPLFNQMMGGEDGVWEGTKPEEMQKWSVGTFKYAISLIEQARRQSTGITDTQAWSQIRQDRQFAWRRLQDTYQPVTLENGKTIATYDQGVLNEVGGMFPGTKNWKATQDYEIAGGEKEFELGDIDIKTTKRVERLTLKGRKTVDEPMSVDEISKSMPFNKEIRLWFEYHYVGNGVFKDKSKSEYEATIGDKTGVPWETAKQIMIASQIQPRQQAKGKERYRKKGEGGAGTKPTGQPKDGDEFLKKHGS